MRRGGRMPGFELAGYARAVLDAYSSRRWEIFHSLAANGLPYTPELAHAGGVSHARAEGRHRARGAHSATARPGARARAFPLPPRAASLMYLFSAPPWNLWVESPQ